MLNLSFIYYTINTTGGFHQEERALVPRTGADDQVQEESRDTVPFGIRVPVPHTRLPTPETPERGLGLIVAAGVG